MLKTINLLTIVSYNGVDGDNNDNNNSNKVFFSKFFKSFVNLSMLVCVRVFCSIALVARDRV